MIVVTVFLSIFWTKWSSIWFKIERKTVTTTIPHSIWKEMEYYFSQCSSSNPVFLIRCDRRHVRHFFFIVRHSLFVTIVRHWVFAMVGNFLYAIVIFTYFFINLSLCNGVPLWNGAALYNWHSWNRIAEFGEVCRWALYYLPPPPSNPPLPFLCYPTNSRGDLVYWSLRMFTNLILNYQFYGQNVHKSDSE